MKFKKVEIQAFRAYNNVEDGTFDFMTKSNEIADFISIYAPNGFGKTSFYDAVEWGFTNNIGRFLRRKNDNKNSAKAEDSSYIVRNKFADPSIESFVRLYTTLDKDAIIEQKIRKLKANQRDFKFDEKETIEERKYFQEVLLSQEWIDAFLKEDDASIRYDKFIRSFGDTNLDNKYKIIIELIKHNDSRIESFELEFRALQAKIDFDFDPEILTKINSEIESLNKKGEKIPLIRVDFNETDIHKLTDLISERLYELQSDITKHQAKIANIDSAITGNNISDVGVELYFANREKVKQLNGQIVDLNKLKKLFEQSHEAERTKKSKEEGLKDVIDAKAVILELVSTYPKYQEINREITNLTSAIGNESKELKDFNSRLEPILKYCGETKINIEINIENRQKYSSKLNAIPELSKTLTTKNEEKKKITTLIDFIVKENSEREKKILANEKELKEWESIVNQISADKFQILEEKVKPFEDIIKPLTNRTFLINEVKKALNKIQEDISNANKLNADVEQLIAMGADIVNKNESSICPLCKQEYDSFSTLIQKFSNNAFLSEKMKNLLNQKTENEKKLDELLANQNEQKVNLFKNIELSLSGLKERQDSEISAKNQAELTINENKSNVQRLEADINSVLKELEGNDIEAIKSDLSEKISKVSKIIEELKISLEEKAKEKESLEQKISIIKTLQIPALEVKIKDLKENTLFIKINNFAKENQLEESTIAVTLDIQRREIQEKIELLKKKIEEATQSIVEYKKQLEKHDEDKTTLRIQQFEGEKESINQKLISFEYFVKKEFQFDLIGKEKNEIEEILQEKNDSYQKIVVQKEEYVQSFEKTKEYKENVLPFLRHEELKRSQEKILTDKSFLEKEIRPKLEQEKISISEFVNKQIESFFHGKLINSLYKKIDPHPKYKEIKFESDFSMDKPRLNVFVTGENGDTPLVPTLYFSTAQLNILSLSIFLAKALNVKDNDGNPVDCIFIDDPIQSMDSINILSTIDLLRSIVVNMGKQIILATHDENFQNLLQKKIPSNKFKAKYIELETFGKVKQQ